MADAIQSIEVPVPITNDEEITDPKNASSLVVPERVAAGGDSESHNTPDFSAPEFNTHGGSNEKSKKYNSRRRKTRCYNCGRRGHEGHHCRKVTNCFICSKRGHLVMSCPNKVAGEDFTSRLCLKCGNTGHDMFSCANAYDPEDLEGIECYICGKVGHLCCVEDRTKEQTEDACYNCGQWGHLGSECTEVLGSFCNKCKIKGHYTKRCPEKGRAAMKRSQKAARKRSRRKLNPTISAAACIKINLACQNQPDGGPQPPPAGTVNGRGSNTRYFNYSGGDQNICLNVSEIPSNQENETRQPTMVQLPAPDVSNERYSHVPANHHTLENNLHQPRAMGSEIWAVLNPLNYPPLLTQIPFNRESLMRSEIRRQVVQHHMDSRVPYYTPLPTQFSHNSPPPRICNHQLYAHDRPHIRRFPMVQHPPPVIIRQMDSRVPLPTQFSHQLRNNPFAEPPTGTFNPRQHLAPRARVPRPHPDWTFRGSY